MKVKIIAAVAKNRVIGNGPEIPWYIPEDFKHFKECTTGNVVVMGETTYKSMGKALPNRHNIVLSFDLKELPDADVYNDYVVGLDVAKKYAEDHSCDVFIIGGGAIYKLGMNDADELYISEVKGDYEGDVFFPDYSDWVEVSSEDKGKFVFKIFRRKDD